MRGILGLVVVWLLGGCSVDALDGGNVTLTLQSQDRIVSRSQPGTFRVTATNSSEGRVEWGSGSSSCQLGLFVVGASSTRQEAATNRACTADFVTQGLDPGESRTETFSWGGEVLRNGDAVLLPAGAYRLVATAGEKGESGPLDVQVAVLPE